MRWQVSVSDWLPASAGGSIRINWTTTTGNIVVFTGIIPVAKDEDGLAAILGHGSSLL
jgi:Zn-dependent protease with chaperone function